MSKAAVTVMASDRPGIVCEVSRLLASLNCNIEDISQTVLQEEFAGIFIVALPEGLDCDRLDAALKEGLQPLGFHPFTKPVREKQPREEAEAGEPFVVVSIGPDRVGLIAALTCVMKEHGVNIVNLQFVNRSPSFPGHTVTIYEVDVPPSVDLAGFTQRITQEAEGAGLEISVQHKRIFEDICRI
jgi:glycine cleavage system transcriptional repressor